MQYDLKRDGNLIGTVNITDRGVAIDEDLVHVLGDGTDFVATGFDRKEHTFQFISSSRTRAEILAALKRHLHCRGYELII